MNERKCDICGRIADKNHRVNFNAKLKCYLCQKHQTQVYKYGKITDESSFSRKDINTYILFDNYAKVIVYNFAGKENGSFLIDIDDIEKCKKHKWSIKKGNNGYNTIVSDAGKTKLYLHRYILNYNGNMQIDHINRNALDNRKQNLRIVTSCENNANKGKDNIYLQKNGKYKCIFRRYGINYYIGYFDSYEKALEEKEKAIARIESNKEKLEQEYYDKRNLAGKWIAPTPSGKWRAFSQKKSKLISIGVYDTIEQAQMARDEFIKSQAG